MHESYHVYYFNCVTGDETARSGTAPRKSVQFRKMELQEFRGTRERANETPPIRHNTRFSTHVCLNWQKY